MKKILSILLTIVLMVSALPFGLFTITVSAATSGYYTYTVSNGEATITDVSTSISGAVTIPSTLGGYPVTSIGNSAFYYCSKLTSITIPDSVTSIGIIAFEDCKSLTSITIPDSVMSIGSSAFNNTAYYNNSSNWENGVLYIGKHLIDVQTSTSGAYKIKDGTLTIAGDAFYNCSSLTSIIIPDSVTSIGDEAFYRCSSLTSITIPDSVTSIGIIAFEDCKSLTSITIPDSVTSIGYSAFYGCSSLTSITIPDSVTSIGSWAFYDCESLTSITIPDSVTSIGDDAFYGCSSLECITVDNNNKVYHSDGNCLIETSSKTLIAGCKNSDIPSDGSVTSIGDRAFYNCDNLTTITIGDSVTSIGNWAFGYCTSLTSITIGDSVTSIGNGAFSSCSSLESITVDENNKVYHSDGNCLIETSSKTLIAGCKNSVIPSDGSVTSIGDSAFWGCSSLTSITIPDSVTSIGNYAFYYCSSLTSINIPDSVTSIGDYAFSWCTSLKTVYYGGTKAQWNAISIGGGNEDLLNANLKCALGMVSEGSVRHEGVDKNGNYQSAGIRFKSRISSEFRKSATELGFVAVPTALLGDMTIAEYIALEDNQALTAKVKGEGMKEVIYAVSTDANGQKYYDYQMMIKGLTREGVAENLLDTEITVVMYAIVDGETVYTETMAYSYNWFVAQTTK